MKNTMASQGLSCVRKLLTSPSHTRLCFRTFIRLNPSENYKKGLFAPVLVVRNCDSLRNVIKCFTTLHPNYTNDCQSVERATSTLYNGSVVEFRISRVMTPTFTSASSYSSSTIDSGTISDPLKSHSVLQVKRPVRIKLTTETEENNILQTENVVAHAIAEDIDLPGLEKHLVKQSLYNIGQLPQDVTYALHVRGKYNIDQKPKEIFVFEDGSVIFWCVPKVERGTFLKILEKFAKGPYSSSLSLHEKEKIDLTFASGKTCLSRDKIQLKESDKDSLHRILEMYAFSNALAQSVKLGMWEASFNKLVASIENVTEDLRQGRKISMSRQQVLMKIGELFSLRHQINLSSDLLDTPDFYWDRVALEPLYISLCNHLSISRRTKVMNQKLNHCSELTELLSSQLNDAHHTRLEVMIIVLILVEVLFEVVHTIEKYYEKQSRFTETDEENRKESVTI